MSNAPPSTLANPILVTGATGFIGSHLCRRLVEQGHRVLGTTRRKDAVLPRGVEPIPVDLVQHADVLRVFETWKPQTVFHLAGHVVGRRGVEEVLPSFQNTLESTIHLLIASQGRISGRFVFSGSQEEPETTTSAPSSPYAASKQAATSFARMFHALYQFPVVIARVFMVYGPDQKDRSKLIPYVIESFLQGKAPQLGSGTRPVDWIHVNDVVDGLLALATAPGIEGMTLDLGTGKLATIREVVETLAAVIPNAPQPIFNPASDRPMEQIRQAHAEATLKATGWAASISLRKGLADTVRWHCEQHAKTI